MVQPNQFSKPLDFSLCQMPPLAYLEVPRCETGEMRARQRQHPMSCCLAHPLHLSFSPLVKHQFQFCIPTSCAQHANMCRGSDALAELHPLSQSCQYRLAGMPAHPGAIDFFYAISRMGQSKGQIPVIHQQQNPSRIQIEPSDGKNPNINAAQQVVNCLGMMRVVRRYQISPGVCAIKYKFVDQPIGSPCH